jgi:hypothetical protein
MHLATQIIPQVSANPGELRRDASVSMVQAERRQTVKNPELLQTCLGKLSVIEDVYKSEAEPIGLPTADPAASDRFT